MTVEDTLTITVEDVTRWRNERRAKEPPTVTYTGWTPVYGPDRERMVASEWGLFNVWVYKKVIDQPLVGWERDRLERWYDADGRLMGRRIPEFRPARDGE